MESLRRLTSSVFDTGPVRLVRRASMGDVRPPDARSLELTFMTERLVVAGAPCDGPTDKKRNVVNADELAQYLDASHRGRFLLFNLNALDDAHDAADRLHEQMLEFNWERDGMKAHTPPFDLVFRICYALHAWLALDAQHVALLNCQTGKTRSGVVVACFLLFARLADDPTDAFVEFYRKRWDMKSLTPQALEKKTPPSIRRFLSGFHELLDTHKPRNDKPLLLKAIIFRQLPVELQPCVQIWDDYKLVFCTDALHVAESGEAPVLDWNEEDGFFAILWENGVELDGGFSILCSFGEDYDNADDVDASSRVLFRYADSTLFLLPGLVTLKKQDLDLMKQYEHGFDEDQFSVDLVLHENSGKKSRNLGLVEITKHHVVLPDPAMHSNFIRMGFCETPTTFALQCSQNAPNVALDLLHSKGLSACFAHEQQEIAAKKEQNAAKDSQIAESSTETERQPLFRRQSTAEIAAMQSQRSRYSIPTAVDSSMCDTCKEDDYMMRPQIVKFAMSLADALSTATSTATLPSKPPKLGMKSALLSELKTARKSNGSSDAPTASNGDNKYTLMLKRGVPFEAVQNCMRKDGVDPSTLQPLSPSETTPGDTDANEEPQKIRLKDMEEYASYFRMMRMGCPKEAVRQKLMMDGLDPIILDLGSDAIYEEVKNRIAATHSVSKLQDDIKCVNAPVVKNAEGASSDVLLKDHELYAKYFKMLNMGLPEGAVRQKMKADGVDEHALDLGGDSPFSKLPKPTEKEVASKNDVKLKDDPTFAKYFKMLQMGLPEGAIRQKMKVDGVDERALGLGGDAMVSQLAGPSGGSNVKLQDDPTYAKYFKMLKMGLPEGAVRQKMKSEGVDERALDLGGDALVSDLAAPENDMKLQDDPVYAKYFKMLKMGLPEGAVRQKMVTESVDVRALELGPDATVSQLTSGGNAKTSAAVVKPKRPRKKLHWQAISEDRLSNLNQQTIWHDEDEDVDFDVDMDELEALFFSNQNTGSGKKNSSRGQSKALKRKQTVSLIDGKRAMNAAISLARVKLSYSEIAEAVTRFDLSGLTVEQLIGINEFLPTSEEAALVSGYTGDKGMLGEAEKFILEIAKVKRYAPRMECLVYKLSFSSRSAELAASLSHLQKAAEEVKGSRLLKILLAMVLKLGNSLNGSGEDNGIKGFTVDSLLRLGHTKAVNQKTTVLHYLVRLVKKNHPQVLDFQDELRSVPLAARESFETVDEDFKKLEKGLASLNIELKLLEKQAVESLGLEVTIKSMQTAASDIEAQMKTLADGIARAREEVSSVLDYFGEDPKRNPTEFFTTLASFCSVFQRARNEVDAADEAAQRAERVKMRRSNTLRAPLKSNNGATVKVSRPILERSQTERAVEKRHPDDN
uniref:FH2 domain-containing protein n=1 Tax=Phytophthora ramorum TaxID=164328 RepID=H3H2R5_PHYRM